MVQDLRQLFEVALQEKVQDSSTALRTDRCSPLVLGSRMYKSLRRRNEK